jgi:hypothetical protein
MGLIVFVAGFYLSTLRPEQSRLEELQRLTAAAREQGPAAASNAGVGLSPSDKLAAFYEFFPKDGNLPDLLEKVFAAARAEGLQVEQGDYRVVPSISNGLAQFQLTLPVRGTYPQIRRFVDIAMSDVSSLVLDSIQFERRKVGDASVEAKVKLTAYLGKKS